MSDSGDRGRTSAERLAFEEALARVRREFAASQSSKTTLESSPTSHPLRSSANGHTTPSVLDLLHLQHDAFVSAAYEAILGRSPNSEELQSALRWLASGGSKIRVLGGLRYSREGRLHGVQLHGLAWRHAADRMFQLPVLGILLQIAVTIARLPSVMRHHRALEFALAELDAQQATRQRLGQLEHAGEVVALALHQEHELLSATVEATLQSLSEKLASTERSLDANIISLATEVQQTRDWTARQEARDDAATHEAAKQAKHLAARVAFMDVFYAQLEEKFRGSRDEIRARAAVYLPVLEQWAIGGADRPVLDIGCGRGEWLEVLKERGLTGRGIDISNISCVSCRDRGLEVAQADALAYLVALPDASFGAITGIHVAEHLQFENLLELIRQCIRVLQPGGLLILETPNPNNVLVATSSFHLDPTHRNPIPPALLKFAMESSGLTSVDVLDLHPSVHRWTGDGSEMDRFLIANLFGAQDYAAIGRKPPAKIAAIQSITNQ